MAAKYSLAKLIYELDVDEKGFHGKLENAEKAVTRFEEKCKKFGDNATKYVTLPIIAMGTAALKFAADAEVSSRKFAKAFSGAEKEAADAVKNLNNQYKLSQTQSRQLLAYTGDLLKGFGATSKQAAQTSLSVQQLAASLAAYNGIPVRQASEAITKAMLGETEGLKTLGVAIREDLIQKQLQIEGNDKLTGTAKNLAKANAVLKLAYDQSQDAVGSFAENTDTAAAKAEQLKGQLMDAAVSLGNQLLPVLKDGLDFVSGLVKGFTDLDEGTKRTIITMLALAAAVGPATKMIGGLTKGLNVLMKNPWAIVLAGVAAGLVILSEKLRQQYDYTGNLDRATSDLVESSTDLEEINKKLKDSTKELTDKEKEQLEVRKEQLEVQQKGNMAVLIDEYLKANTAVDEYNKGLEKNLYFQKNLTEGYNALSQVAEWSHEARMAIESRGAFETEIEYQARLQKKYEEVKGKVDELNAVRDKSIQKLSELVYHDKISITEIEKHNKALADRVRTRAEEIPEIEAKRAADKKDAEEQAENDAKATTAAEKLKAKKKEVADLSKSIIESEKTALEKLYGTRQKLQSQELEGEANQKRLAAIKLVNEKIKEEEANVAREKLQIQDEYHQRLLEQQGDNLDAQLELLEIEKQQAIDAAHEAGIATLEIEKYYENEKDRVKKEFADRQQERIENELQANRMYYDVAGDLLSSFGEALVTGQEGWVNLGRAAVGSLAAIVDALANEAIAQGIKELALGFANTLIPPLFGSEHFSAAAEWGALAVAGKIAAGVIRGLASQIKLAAGGWGDPIPGGVPATILEGADTEAVLPLNDEIFRRLSEGIVAANQGTFVRDAAAGQPTTIVVKLGEKVIAAATVRLINGGTYTIKAGAIK